VEEEERRGNELKAHPSALLLSFAAEIAKSSFLSPPRSPPQKGIQKRSVDFGHADHTTAMNPQAICLWEGSVLDFGNGSVWVTKDAGKVTSHRVSGSNLMT
jgi:hypothetical protein